MCFRGRRGFLRMTAGNHALSPVLTATRRLLLGARIGEFHVWYHGIFLLNGCQQLVYTIIFLINAPGRNNSNSRLALNKTKINLNVLGWRYF